MWLFLLNDNSCTIRRFENRSAAGTYFIRVAMNVFTDLRRRRDGRWRSSAATRRLGPLARELDALVARDRFTPHEAIEIMHARRAASRSELESVLAQLQTAVRLRPRLDTLSLHSVGSRVDVPGPANPESLMIKDELRRQLGHARHMIEQAWGLLSVEERLALATRFAAAAPSRRLPVAAGSTAKALRALSELVASAGVTRPEAFAVLRELGLDLGLRQILAPPNEAISEPSATAGRSESKERREEKTWGR